MKQRDASNDFLYGKPSSTYAVAGTQIIEIDEETADQNDVDRQLWNEEEEYDEDVSQEEAEADDEDDDVDGTTYDQDNDQ